MHLQMSRMDCNLVIALSKPGASMVMKSTTHAQQRTNTRDKAEGVSMSSADFRVESSHPISGRLWPLGGSQQYFFSDRSLAVAMAAKSVTKPSGQEIRVVHVPTGEVVFTKPGRLSRAEWADD
jgi:hypothetical protein